MAALILNPISIAVIAEEVPERAAIPTEYKWDLSGMYEDATGWQADKTRFLEMLPGIARFKGKLGESGSHLLEAIEEIQAVEAVISNLYVYAGLKSYEDTRYLCKWRAPIRSARPLFSIPAGVVLFLSRAIGDPHKHTESIHRDNAGPENICALFG